MPIGPVCGRGLPQVGLPSAPQYDVGWSLEEGTRWVWVRPNDQHPGMVWDALGGWVEPGWRERHEAQREADRLALVASECRQREEMLGL